MSEKEILEEKDINTNNLEYYHYNIAGKENSGSDISKTTENDTDLLKNHKIGLSLENSVIDNPEDPDCPYIVYDHSLFDSTVVSEVK